MVRWLLLICCAPLLFAQGDEVRKLLKDSEIAWNRADLVTFASFYDDSAEAGAAPHAHWVAHYSRSFELGRGT